MSDRPVKTHRKRLRRHFRREVNGDEDGILVMIVFVPCRLVPIGIEPLAYRGHARRKLSRVEPDRDAAHHPLARCLVDVIILLLQTKDENR